MITVITKPISLIYNILKYFKNIILKLQKKQLPDNKYGGHYAVTRSIIEGFKKNDVNFNYNPSNVSKIGEIVYVPGGLQALKWSIKMKKKGKIKKLVVGPNLVVTPDNYNGIIKSKYIDLFLVNSQWIKDFYTESAPELENHIDIWPAGVDTEFWTPKKQPGFEKNILIYYKRPIKKMFEACKKVIEDAGYKVEIITYGKYTVDQYKSALNRNNFLIHFVEQESQGISLAEAWSMNTPSIVWNPGYYPFEGGINAYSSSSPYLSNQTGLFFKDVSEFELIIKNLYLNNFQPRNWVLDNMSDEICTKNLIDLINKQHFI